ncbi:mechanosensitive ion channel family protein [Flavobacterium ardleyense]|uniref:mechanosensitive ion channel family protein n=1 Tax=Flavobacterium ardleyense TaxID=2038737 RepID=UPI00298D4045|nr:mechanosensitive ion channel family protein [Flavobacterium ardleyense]
MEDETAGFTANIEESINAYYNSFVHALPRFVFALLILIITFFVAKYFSNLIRTRYINKDHDPLFVNFLSKTVKFILIVIGVIIAMNVIGLSGIAQGLLAGAGVGAFIFGFAFKDIAENFLGGMILAFNRPFSLNDTIMVREFSGHVVALNFRTTHIKTFDERDVFIPNSIMIKEPLINYTRDGKIRIDFLVGIAYEDDITTAIDTIKRTIRPIQDLKKNTEAFAVVEELATSTVNLRVYFWTDTMDYKRSVLEIKSEVISKVKEVLVADGFSLPADIQEFKLYDKQEPLPINILNIKDARAQ